MPDTINATMVKFGHPHSVVVETPFWTVQVRPQQPTLGSLVLICREPVQAFGAVSPVAMAALQPVVAQTERVLREFCAYAKINYLMLMMVDPDVHFHVIPRYEGSRAYEDVSFTDIGWPGPPALTGAVALTEAQVATMAARLSELWHKVA